MTEFPKSGSAMRRLMLCTIAGASLVATMAWAAPAIEKSVKVAPGVYEVVVSPSSKTVYVAAAGGRGATSAKIVTFDATTLAQKGEIDVSAAPLFGLGLNEATQTLYGTGTRAGVLSAIDLKTGKVAASITDPSPGGSNAHLREVAVDQATNTIYATVVGSRGAANPDAPKGELWVIDGKSHKVTQVVTSPAQTVVGVAFDPSTRRVYTTDMVGHQIVVFDAAAGHKQVATWPAGGEQPMNIAVDTAGSRIFVSNQGTGTLTVIDTKSGKLIKSIPTGGGALSVAYAPKNGHVYVTNRNAGTTSVVDAKSLEVIANLPTGSMPQTVTVDHATGLVYVTNKARAGGGRGRGAASAPATPPAPPAEDPNGDTLTLIRP